MYLIPKGIGEQSAESVLGVSYSECAGSWAEAGMEEARVQCLNLSFWKWIYTSRMLLLFSHPIISNSLQLHGLQHARPPHPYCLPRFAHVHVHWYHAAISSSDTLFSFCPQSFPASGTFPMSHLFTSDDWSFSFSISPSNEYSVLISFRIDWFDILAVQGDFYQLETRKLNDSV